MSSIRALACMRRAMLLLVLATGALLGGCASFYTDTNTKEVPSSTFKVPAQPRPVQLLFEFQTNGTANASATKILKDQVAEQVKGSGLFAAISETPAPGGALLSITLNSVPLTDDVFLKGFVTGLTFGLAGSKVSDGYICTATYTAGAGGAPVVKQVRHAIHTVVGAGSAPADGVKADSIEAAVRTMTRQVLSNALNDLSQAGALQ